MKTKELSLSALLIALALGLSYTERFIPLNLLIPLPGVKLGLANVVTLFALYTMNKRQTAMILLIRCLMGSMFGGGITALAYSLTGGFLALLAMAAVKKLKFLSVYGASVLGAAAHNIGQVLAAMTLLGSKYIISYLPLLLITGIFCGLTTGALSAGVLRALRGSQREGVVTRYA